jgi:hypothetical protein
MAWTNFQKSNWTRTTSSEHARQYFPATVGGSISGTSVAGTVTGGIVFAANQTRVLTLTAAFQFQGNGQVMVSAPEGASNYATAAAQGLVIDNAWIQGPASGSYSAGNHPLIMVNLSTNVALTTAATGFDLIAVQY